MTNEDAGQLTCDRALTSDQFKEYGLKFTECGNKADVYIAAFWQATVEDTGSYHGVELPSVIVDIDVATDDDRCGTVHHGIYVVIDGDVEDVTERDVCEAIAGLYYSLQAIAEPGGCRRGHKKTLSKLFDVLK